MIILIIHIIVSYNQHISLIIYVKDGSHARLWHPSCIYITAQRQYTAVQKMCTLLEITFLALHPWHRVDIKRGLVYCKQAGQNCTIIEELWSFVYILKNKLFFSASLVYYFCLHFREKISIYLPDHLVFSK